MTNQPAKRRRVVFLSGTRADFGKIKSLIQAASNHEELEAHIFVTGMHMEPRYGYTVTEIEKCGFTNIYRYINQSGRGHMDGSLASTVTGFGDYVRLVQPDLIVVHGDRVEALAGALAGSLNNILVAHVEGGEVSGTVDELIRHAISKISHIHFVSNEEAKRRLVQLGEDPEAVYVIGSPDVDIMSSPDLPALADVRAHYEIPFEEFGILLYHPVTTATERTRQEVQALTLAVLETGENYIVIYPNNDHGAGIIFDEYAASLAGKSQIRTFPSIRFEAMLVLLKSSMMIVGNSSMGIREAPYFGVPTVNIGSRQDGRSRNGQLIHVPGERQAILEGMRQARRLRRTLAPIREFGGGDSHVQFVRVLEDSNVWQTPVQKRFRDVDFAEAAAGIGASHRPGSWGFQGPPTEEPSNACG